ncbi:MAG: CRISPR-associated protein Cas4 [Paramuribaculum sp.]|nr:CRISPR-associated protein Cas4 [Paramuribaculum sp.]
MRQNIGHYTDDEMIPLSGIQHFLFCDRQWALIHLECQWQENLLTAEGALLHDRVDDPSVRKSGQHGIVTLRGLHVASRRLGLFGVADAVEFHPLTVGKRSVAELMAGRDFTIMPVEYKRGHRKINDCDRYQAAAQAIALEEMFGVEVSHAAVFYWEERRREYIDVDDEIRSGVAEVSRRMHETYMSGLTPHAKRTSACRACSMVDICMSGRIKSDVTDYIKTMFDEEIA